MRKQKTPLVVLLSVLFVICSYSMFIIFESNGHGFQKAIPTATMEPNYWKVSIPSSIPEFRYGMKAAGSFSKLESDGITYFMSYNGVSTRDIDAYANDLQVAGFDCTIIEDDDSLFVDGSQYTDGDGISDHSSLPNVIASYHFADGSCFVTVKLKIQPEQ